MLSKLILLLGTLISFFIAYACIEKQSKLLTPPHPASDTLTAIPEESTQEEPIPVEIQEITQEQPSPTIEKENPSFDYRNAPEKVIEFKLSAADKNESYLVQLDSYCKKSECTQKLHFEAEVSEASWKEDALKLIAFIEEHQINDASIHIEDHTISVSGTFANEAQKDAFMKLLASFQQNGFEIKTTLNVTPPQEAPKTEEVLPQEMEPEKIIIPTEPPKTDTNRSSITLEDVQQTAIKKMQEDINTLLKTSPIYFKHNSDELTLESKKILDKIIDIVNKTDAQIKRLKISGHTDASGSAAYNKLLSQKRAESVRNYLRTHNIKVPSLEAIGYGEERPITANPYARKNRRVEIEIEKEKSYE